MTDQVRSTEEIEDDIARERARLSESLDDLQNRFSLDGIVQQIGDQFSEHGGDIGDKIARTVKENPTAVALTGIGLAWLAFGKSRDPDAARYAKYSEKSNYGSTGSVSRPSPDFKNTPDDLPDWAASDRNLMDEDDASLHRRLQLGTEDLSEAARTRVAEARKAALEAVEHQSKVAGDLYDRKPLLAGVAAAAVGALVGAAISRSKTEDEMLGASRDRLMSRAEELYRAEKAKLTEVAHATKEELHAVAREKKDALPNKDEISTTVQGEVKKSVKRVASTAEKTAKKNKLGQPLS